MLKVVLCDDCKESIGQYAELILQCAEKNQMQIELSSFDSGESLLFHFCDAPNRADIIYLDILMDKTDGIETGRILRDLGCHAQIIFLTSSGDYVYDAFDVNAVQYLLKNELTPEKFEHTFLRAAADVSHKKEELFVCEFNGTKNAIPIHQISYFEIWKRLVTVHFNGNDTTQFYATMEHLENQLSDKHFIRVHRSYLVHLPYIRQFLHNSLLLKTGSRIPVGITYLQSLKKTFSDYVTRSHIYDSNRKKNPEERS